MSTPPLDASDVVQFTSRLSSIASMLQATRRRANWLPTEPSQAMDEIAEEVKYLGDRRQIEVASAHCDLFLSACEDNVKATAVLCTLDDYPVIAHFTTTRAAIEAASRVRWLADPEVAATTTLRTPGVRARTRISRLLSLRWAAQSSAKVLQTTDRQKKLGERVRREIEEVAADYGLEKRTEKRSPASFGGQPVPTYTALVGQVLKPRGDNIYRLFAAVAHSAEHGLGEFLARTENGGTILVARRGGLITPLSIASIAYLVGAETVCRYMGWAFPGEEADDLRRLVQGYQGRASAEWPETSV